MSKWEIMSLEEGAKRGLVPKSYSNILDLQAAADYLGLSKITLQIQAGKGKLQAFRIGDRTLVTTKKWCKAYKKNFQGQPGLRLGQRRGPSKPKGEESDND